MKSATRKGVAWMQILLIALALVGGVTLGTMFLGGEDQPETAAVVDGSGEFDNFQPLQELNGNDVSVTEQSLNDTVFSDGDNILDSNVVLKTNFTESDGQDWTWAIPFEVSNGGLEDVDFEAALNTAVNTSDVEIRDSYLIEDVEANDLGRADALQTFNVEDNNEVDATVNSLAGGDYAFVLEAKSINPDVGRTSDDENILDFDIEGDTSEDNDLIAGILDNVS